MNPIRISFLIVFNRFGLKIEIQSLSAIEPKDEEPFPEFQEEDIVPEHRALLGRREEPCLEAYEPKNNVTFIWITALLDLLFENT